jgi:glycosyltransferase involved in cell wall biosynthesis
LKRAIQHVFEQTYQDFRLFIVGDKYEDNDEFEGIISCFGHNNICLWRSGGTNALNHAISLAKQEGITKMCHLDHDDYWLPDHLELIHKTVVEKNPPFIHTLSAYKEKPAFPEVVVDGQVVEHYPTAGKVIHSSIYMDMVQLPLEYRDRSQEGWAGDADMIAQVRDHCHRNGLKCYLIRKVTCVHDRAGWDWARYP